MRTAILLTAWAPNNDFFDEFIEEWAAESPLVVGTTEVPFGYDWFALVQVPDLDGPYLVSVPDNLVIENETDNLGIVLPADDDVFDPPCPFACDWAPGQTGSVRLTELVEQTLQVPTRASAELPPGTGYAFRIDGSGYVEIKVSGGDHIDIQTRDEPQVVFERDYVDSSSGCATPCYAYIYNGGDKAESFEATFVEGS